MEKGWESESPRKEAWPHLRVPSSKGDTVSLRPLCPSSVLGGLFWALLGGCLLCLAF